MKFLKYASVFMVMALLATLVSCKKDDPDPEPEEDTVAPVVSITYPADGGTVATTEATVSLTIEYEVTDDKEIASVVVEFDGTQVSETTSFLDYRVVDGEEVVAGVADGTHTITIIATDKGDNTTTETATFTKSTVEPYTPMDNEILYMAFEGNYIESVSATTATVVGSPGFAGEGSEGNDAYAGATNAYLTLAADDLKPAELTASFYMKVNSTPDRAGILVMSPPDNDNPTAPNVRTSGFRFFREAAGDKQIFKLNVGIGDDEVWLDGGVLAQVVPNTDEWVHFAFLIGSTATSLYIDGVKVAENTDFAGIDWTGCDLLSIMSGAPLFTGWEHKSDLSYLDELRIFDKVLSETELEDLTGLDFGEPNNDPGIDPVVGPDAVETLYMSFDTDFSIAVSDAVATAVGTPTVAAGGVSGSAYVGATDSYLTIPSDGLLNDEFSVSFWHNLNADPDRAGILVIGPPDEVNPTTPNNRTSGVRFFRENAGGKQRFKLNVGDGTTDTWIDGGAFADVATDQGWVHMAFTVSQTRAQVWVNGILVAAGDFEGIDWTGCDIISVGSGAPRFTEWNHLSDLSSIDELRMYNGVLNPTQIAALKAVGD
ncbi:MAG: LamG-like jellyroll fold domain-containing protein [Bacteroidales bacterium]